LIKWYFHDTVLDEIKVDYMVGKMTIEEMTGDKIVAE
jgi:hypothetical protein